MRSLALAGALAALLAGCAMDSVEAEDSAADESELAETRTDFYAIAHMTNTPEAARWAVAQGANALEIDVRFEADGAPGWARHGGVCDCVCAFDDRDHVCKVFDGSCEASAPVKTMLATFAAMPSLALVVLDSKVSGSDPIAVQEAAGRRIIEAIDSDLFGAGYEGKVVVGAAKTDAHAYVSAAATAAERSAHRRRIYFGFDEMGTSESDAACTLQTLGRIAPKNRVFGAGTTACGVGNFSGAIRTAAANERAGVSSLTYVWTLDNPESMRQYIALGARGILTNEPRKLVEVARDLGLTLATPRSAMPAATSDDVLGRADCGCDCDYHPGGCTISKPAPPGRACKCAYEGLWSCSGAITDCADPNDEKCRAPDTSRGACALGGGDCEGY